MEQVRSGTLWMTLVLLMFLSSGVCNGQDYCMAKTSRYNDDADVYFALMLSLRKSPNSQNPCTLINRDALQQYVAAAWIVDKLNEGYPNSSYIPGVKFGFELYDSCQSTVYAARNVFQILNPSLSQEITVCHSSRNSSLLLGISGPSRSSTAVEVSRLLKDSRIPIVSASATADELSNKTLYPTFFRTAFPDTYQIKPILEILKRLKWTFVAVVHSDDVYGRTAATMLHDRGRKEKICFVLSIEVSRTTEASKVFDQLKKLKLDAKDDTIGVVYFGLQDTAENLMFYFSSKQASENIHWIMSDAVGRNPDVFASKNHVSGILTLSPSDVVLSGLKDYYLSKQNSDPLIQKYRQQQNDDNNNNGNTFRQSDYAPLSVDTYYTFAVAAKNAHEDHCKGNHGLCDSMKTAIKDRKFIDYVRKVDVNYTSLGSFAPSEFVDAKRRFSFDDNFAVAREDDTVIYKINSVDRNNDGMFVEVGNYSTEKMFLNKDLIRMWKNNVLVSGPKLPTSSCRSVCRECFEFGQIPMVLVPGDLYIPGIFSIHTVDPGNPFQCAGFREVASDTILLEAFLFAVRHLNTLTNLKFGAIAWDDCYSPVRITSILSDYYSGLVPPNNEQFTRLIPRNKTVAVIGPLSSGSTIPLTQFYSRLNIPVVSYSASSSDLDDRVNFPNFLRTVPSDVTQAKVMVDIILQMKWEYVGLLYVGNNYGTKGKQAFQTLAAIHNICVAEPVEIAESGDSLFSVQLNTLRSQQVEVVVFFGIDSRYADFLRFMRDHKILGKFIMIASEEWGTKASLLEEGDKAARGSITIKLQSISSAFSGFRDEILSKNLSNNEQNPWFEEYWQNQFKCNIDGGFNNVMPKTCNGREKLTADNIATHLKDQRVEHVMNAVYAVGIGIKNALKELCQDSDEFPCTYFYQSKYSQTIWQKIRNVEYPERKKSIFDENGNGAIGFNVYNVQQLGSSLTYEEVGSYDTGKLSLKKDQLKFYNELGQPKTINSVCGNSGLCSHCHREREPAVNTETSVNVLDVILVVGIVIIVIIVVLGTICIVLCLRKTARGLRKDIQSHNCGRQEHLYQAVSDIKVYQNPTEPRHQEGQGRYNQSQDTISFMNGSQGTITDVPNGVVNQGFVQDHPSPPPPLTRYDSQTIQGRENNTSSGESVPMTITSSHPSDHATDTDSLALRQISISPTISTASGVMLRNTGNLADIQRMASTTSIPNGQIPQLSYQFHQSPAVRPSDLQLMQAANSPQGNNAANFVPQDQNTLPLSHILSVSDSNLSLFKEAQNPAANLSHQRAVHDQYLSSSDTTCSVPTATSSSAVQSPSDSVLSSGGIHPTEIELQLLQKQKQLQLLQQHERLLQQQQFMQQQQQLLQHQQQQQQQQLQDFHQTPSTSCPVPVTFAPKSTSPTRTVPELSMPTLPVRNQTSLASSKLNGSTDSVQSVGVVPEQTFDKISLDPHGVNARISRV